jgi:hypothetical protein
MRYVIGLLVLLAGCANQASVTPAHTNMEQVIERHEGLPDRPRVSVRIRMPGEPASQPATRPVEVRYAQ